MKVITPSAEVLSENLFLHSPLRKIEWVGRICYKSTENITPLSAKPFVERLIKNGHEAMLEHGSICFKCNWTAYNALSNEAKLMERDGLRSFIRFTCECGQYIVSGNIRAWRDMLRHMTPYIPEFMETVIHEYPVFFPEWIDWDSFIPSTGLMKEISKFFLENELELLTHFDRSVLFTVDRGVSHEIVRHRLASFAQESTRYCNYAKDKFGHELTFIKPCFFDHGTEPYLIWEANMETAESDYIHLINDYGVTPEQARTVLPNSLKTTLVMTANLAEWKHFFELRACNITGKAHPQMQEVSRPLLCEFKKDFPEIFESLAYGE